MTDARLGKLADLAVVVGANVQPGQIVGVTAELDHHDLVRAIAASAYEQGAKFVDVWYVDPYIKRARIQYAPGDSLEFVPPWYGERVLALAGERGANIRVEGPTAPGVLDGLDPKRAGRDLLPRLKETTRFVNERTVNWTIVAYPTLPWAKLCFPDLDDDAALERLWREVEHVSRLDEPDPLAAWEERIQSLERASEALNEARLDAIHFEGEGTDLTIGLFPTSIWRMARWSTIDGTRHLPNVPTEEVFTSPDPARVDGHVRSTKPLVFSDGTLIRGLEVRFEGGRAVEITADEGGEVLRGRTEADEGAARLGEVALVDRESRIGKLGTVFYNTLLDENAASHIALGSGFTWAVESDEDRARINQSAIHIDFMIGGDDVDVTGIRADGERIPVLRDGAWQLEPVHAA
ncbi:MAG TPA: aminopeptidase [Gaiellaceae bacterium]|nr:aminopeptidase [Gaiellaceae bacterium]